MEKYRMMAVEYDFVKLTKENIKEVYDWLKEHYVVDAKMGTEYSLKVYTVPFHTDIILNDYVGMNNKFELVVKDENKFLKEFRKIYI